MNLIQCVNAYTAVQSMMEREWDYKTAHALMMLKRKLQPHGNFFSQEEMKLVNEYAARDEKGRIIWSSPGRFVFRDPDQASEYTRRRTELGMVEVQEEFVPIRVPVPDSIKPVLLEALEGFVQFGEENET